MRLKKKKFSESEEYIERAKKVADVSDYVAFHKYERLVKRVFKKERELKNGKVF